MSIHIIPKGDHFSSILPEIPPIPRIPDLHKGITELKGTVKFDSSCIYDLSNIPECKTDINKVIGFGYGLFPNDHHIWSIRLGFRVDPKQRLLLYNYSYVSRQRISILIGTKTSFTYDTEYPFEIKNDTINKKSIVKIGDYETTIDNFYKVPSWGYILKPYFGGQCTAPHDMKIEIKLI